MVKLITKNSWPWWHPNKSTPLILLNYQKKRKGNFFVLARFFSSSSFVIVVVRVCANFFLLFSFVYFILRSSSSVFFSNINFLVFFDHTTTYSSISRKIVLDETSVAFRLLYIYINTCKSSSFDKHMFRWNIEREPSARLLTSFWKRNNENLDSFSFCFAQLIAFARCCWFSFFRLK